MTTYSSVPIAGLDGITRTDVEREIRGRIHIARLRLRTLESMERPDPKSIRGARRSLLHLYRTARAERVRPFYHGT